MKLIIELEPQVRQIGPGKYVEVISKTMRWESGAEFLTSKSLRCNEQDMRKLLLLASEVEKIVNRENRQGIPDLSAPHKDS